MRSARWRRTGFSDSGVGGLELGVWSRGDDSSFAAPQPLWCFGLPERCDEPARLLDAAPRFSLSPSFFLCCAFVEREGISMGMVE